MSQQKNRIVVDIEATCWKNWENAADMETIEIGAVKLNSKLEVIDDFSIFIRPIICPQLSDFCKRFTSIKQSDVDAADLFPAAFGRFLAWIGPEPYTWYSWSDYDRRRLQDDHLIHELTLPDFFDLHQDLKKLYATKAGLAKPVGMRRALKNLEVTFSGRQHRGIDDARNTAAILRHVLG